MPQHLRDFEKAVWWEDDNGEVLWIRRSVWRTTVKDDTKTQEDEENPGVVPIIRPLRLLLDGILPDPAIGWIFGNRAGGALYLHNLSERVIKPILLANELPWKWWHAYRGGSQQN